MFTSYFFRLNAKSAVHISGFCQEDLDPDQGTRIKDCKSLPFALWRLMAQGQGLWRNMPLTNWPRAFLGPDHGWKFKKSTSISGLWVKKPSINPCTSGGALRVSRGWGQEEGRYSLCVPMEGNASATGREHWGSKRLKGEETFFLFFRQNLAWLF